MEGRKGERGRGGGREGGGEQEEETGAEGGRKRRRRRERSDSGGVRGEEEGWKGRKREVRGGRRRGGRGGRRGVTGSRCVFLGNTSNKRAKEKLKPTPVGEGRVGRAPPWTRKKQKQMRPRLGGKRTKKKDRASEEQKRNQGIDKRVT